MEAVKHNGVIAHQLKETHQPVLLFAKSLVKAETSHAEAHLQTS